MSHALGDALDDGVVDVVLSDQLDQKAAYTLSETLLAARGRGVRLVGGSVRRLGGQSLQVLLAGRTAWESDAKPFVLAQCSAELLAALDLFGATGLFVVEPEVAA